ncbi:helix-turn-helix transcriptional regulator [Nonomuraea sp. NPDC048882]|uniref:helix-turn-helix domain-containing protein n=1 Tax=Nonomuraea sp. NPDC048882 TaxID=3154347 RepID=UPI0033E51DF8
MEQRSWTQTQLAKQLGVSQAWISKVCRGVADTGLARAQELLSRVGWEVRFSPSVEEPVERREFLAAAASVVFVPSTANADPYLDHNYVRTLTDSLARSRYELGGMPLISRALVHTRHVGALRISSLSTQLQEAASDLMYQVSVTLYDAGQLAQSEHAGTVALELAHHAQDFPAQARAYDALSRVALYRSDSTRALQYAQRGLRIPDLPASRASSLYMRLGRALVSIRGHDRDARNALETALDAHGLSPFAEAALGGDVAIGLSQLGEYDHANVLLRKAADAMGQYSPLFQAQYLGRQAQTAIRAGRPGLTAEYMGTLTRALPFISSARVNTRVREILNRTKQWERIPEVHIARERLHGMLAPETTSS